MLLLGRASQRGLRACRLPTPRPRVVQAAQHHFGEAKESSLAKAGSWGNPGYAESACGAHKLARAPSSVIVGIPRSFGHCACLRVDHPTQSNTLLMRHLVGRT